MKKGFMLERVKGLLKIVTFVVAFFLPSIAYANQVTLTWNKPDDSRVTGYNIYCGISGTNYTTAPVQTVNSPDQTSCLILNLEEGQIYDFVATSFDSEGNESEFSEEINYLVPVAASDTDGDGYSETNGDCAGNDISIHPWAIEICGDGIDHDYDGSDLICIPDPADVDEDGDGYTENQGDCNDINSSIHPGAIEICGDGIDQDCNGSDLICIPDPADVDDDGYGNKQEDQSSTDVQGSEPFPQAPMASAGPDQTIDEGETVTLNGSNSNDSDEDIVNYKWE